MVPWHHADQHDNRTHVETSEHAEGDENCTRDIPRCARFPGTDDHHFNAAKGVHGKSHGQQWREPAFGQETTLRGKLGSHASGHQQSGADDDKGRDGHHFDHGKPVFEAAEVAYASGIDQQQHDGENHYPHQGGNGRKPIRHIRGRGQQLSTNGSCDRRPICRA